MVLILLRREKDYTPLPPSLADGSSLTMDAQEIVICNHGPLKRGRSTPKLSDLEHEAGMANGGGG